MSTPEKRVARPHLLRSGIAGLIALAGLVVATGTERFLEPDDPFLDGLTLIGAAVVLLAGIVAVRGVAAGVRAAAAARIGQARGAPLALLVSIFGYMLVVLGVLTALDVPLQGLLVGGALTGVVIGIAAQQTLANFFAGIVLLAARPLSVGEHVILRSGPLGGEYEGTVTDMGIFYVNLLTDHGPVALPNAGVLSAAVGPGARSAVPEEQPAQRAPKRRSRRA